MEILGTLFLNTLEITLAMSALIIVVLIFSRIFGSLFMSRCRYFVWIIIALRLIIPLNINVPEPIRLEDVAAETISPDARTVSRPMTNVVMVQGDTAETPSAAEPTEVPVSSLGSADDDKSPLSPLTILAVVWLSVAAISFSLTVASYLKLMHRLGKHSHLTPEPAFDRLNVLRSEMKIRCTLRVYVSDVATSPMLCGFFRPTVVLPPSDLETEQLDAAISHELIHLRRNDLWVKLLISAARSLHWFNPLVHIMAKYAALDIEFSCDEEALEGSSDEARRIYANALLIFIRKENSKKLPLTTQFDTRKKPIVRRFERILSDKFRLHGTVLTAIVAMLAIALASCISIGAPKRYEELPDDLYYMSNGIIYTAEDGIYGSVTDAFEYTRGRYEQLEPTSETVTLVIDGAEVELLCTYYVASNGNVIRASGNFRTVGYPIDFPSQSLIQKPTLVGSTVENLAIVYVDGGVIRTHRLSDGASISPDGFAESGGNVECLPTDFSPDGTKMLYLSGETTDFGLWLYDSVSGESRLIDGEVYTKVTDVPILIDVYDARFEFMDDGTLLVLPAVMPGGNPAQDSEHLSYTYDIESGTSTPVTEYADLSADRYLFVPNSPYMLHVYEHNIMLNNTQFATWLKPAIPSDNGTTLYWWADSLSPSGRYFWLTTSNFDTFYRVTVHGSNYGDVVYLRYNQPTNVEYVSPVGMVNDRVLLVCETLDDGSYRTIELDFGDGVSDAFETSERQSAPETTVANEPTPTVTTTALPKSTTRRLPESSSDVEDGLREIEPSMLPSPAETKGALATTVKVREDGTIVVEGDREVEQFIAKMADGKPAEWHVVVYRTTELGEVTYYVSELWYDICYDGDHAYYMSYTYTIDETNNEFDLSVTGPHVFSSIESLYCYDSAGNLFHDFYFNMASNKRLSQPIVRYPVASDGVDMAKAQPIFPDDGGYPLEWFATHTQPEWLDYGLIPANVAWYLREWSEDETLDESRRQLAGRLYDETVSFMRRQTYKDFWETHIDGTNYAGDWEAHRWKDLGEE